MLLSRQKFK